MKIPIIQKKLDPDLESTAGHLGVFDRLMMAAKLERWARQLRYSTIQIKINGKRARILRMPPDKLAMN